MKKSILLSMILGASSWAFAQNQPINFEPGGHGANWTWTVFENADNPALEIIANPDPSGINTSATVARFTARQAGNPWAGCESNSGADLGPFVLGPNNTTIKIMVWKSVISDVGIKLATPTGWSQGEIKVPNTLVNQWEEITFNFSSFVNPPGSEGQLSQIVIYPDFDLNGRTQDNIIFFDNITFSEGGPGPEMPLVPAPTPTVDPANVISLFSDVYTNVPVDTWRTDWSSAVYTELEIQGNPTKKYANLDFVGIETVANQLNITGMTHLHLDVWSADFTLFGIKLVDFGPDGAFGGGDDTEHQVNISNPVQGQWVGLDIPLSQFADLANRQNIAQYILVGQPTGNTSVFIDNMYFYNSDNQEPAPMIAAPTPTQPAVNVISLFSDAYNNVPVDTWRTDWSSATLTDVLIAGNPTKKYSNLDFVGIETVANQINISNMTHFRIDVWSANFTFFGVKLVDFGPDGAFGGGDDTEHQVDIISPAQEQWVSLNIPLMDFVGLTNRNNLAQLILVGQPTGAATVYVDNVFFYTTSVNVENVAAETVGFVYPNPVQAGNEVRINSNNINQIEVFDISGKLVHTTRNSIIPTVGLSEGMYFVRIVTQSGAVSTQKLMVK